ncbi:hypothetical protein [Corynebacterium rouxii]|uniref:Uncharacterized protein n=1 Tax=Corynebacterium rouxii TaxID=2719119 RepID=A0A6I8MHK5_9CORY|nr:hypothetical protein [Corynebacterium rouxii]VZH86169.1 hypothetical protein FRC0190_02101 [Corynebacterium rouxii]
MSLNAPRTGMAAPVTAGIALGRVVAVANAEPVVTAQFPPHCPG